MCVNKILQNINTKQTQPFYKNTDMCYHILTNRLFSRLGTLTNAKQNDKLEQTETAKKYKYRKNLHTNQIKTRTFCTLG